MTVQDLLSLLDQGGSTAVLLLGIIALYRGMLIPGREYTRILEERDRALRDRDQWQQAAFRTISVGERVIEKVSP